MDMNDKLVIFLRDTNGYAFSTMNGKILFEDQKFPKLEDAVNYAKANSLDYIIA